MRANNGKEKQYKKMSRGQSWNFRRLTENFLTGTRFDAGCSSRDGRYIDVCIRMDGEQRGSKINTFISLLLE